MITRTLIGHFVYFSGQYDWYKINIKKGVHKSEQILRLAKTDKRFEEQTLIDIRNFAHKCMKKVKKILMVDNGQIKITNIGFHRNKEKELDTSNFDLLLDFTDNGTTTPFVVSVFLNFSFDDQMQFLISDLIDGKQVTHHGVIEKYVRKLILTKYDNNEDEIQRNFRKFKMIQSK